jgi:hypothetical protein
MLPAMMDRVDPAASSNRMGLDAVVSELLRASPFRYSIAETEVEREIAFRLRYRAVVEQGWLVPADGVSEVEQDEYDVRAIHIVGWDGVTPIATGRIVLPPSPLPTEAACAIVVAPQGQVADVGRMVIVRSHQDNQHGAFVGLLASLYSEVRRQGYTVGCGMMAANVRMLMRILGIELEVLGDERPYWNELRAPVRFVLEATASTIIERFASK